MLAQMALFVLMPYIEPAEKPIWFELSKVRRDSVLTNIRLYYNKSFITIGVQD